MPFKCQEIFSKNYEKELRPTSSPARRRQILALDLSPRSHKNSGCMSDCLKHIRAEVLKLFRSTAHQINLDFIAADWKLLTYNYTAQSNFFLLEGILF